MHAIYMQRLASEQEQVVRRQFGGAAAEEGYSARGGARTQRGAGAQSLAPTQQLRPMPPQSTQPPPPQEQKQQHPEPYQLSSPTFQSQQQLSQQPSQQPHFHPLNLAPLTAAAAASASHAGSQSARVGGSTDSIPSLPMRYRDGTFKRTTSEYCYTYRDPSSFAAELGSGLASVPPTGRPDYNLVPGSRLKIRERGRMNAPKDLAHHHFYPRWSEDPAITRNVRPEQHSFRLWGRLNSAHCNIPYTTESQRAFDAQTLEENRDPLDTSRHLRVERKEYKEAFAKAKFQKLIRNDNKTK